MNQYKTMKDRHEREYDTEQDLIDNAALRHGLQLAAADLLAGADEYEEG